MSHLGHANISDRAKSCISCFCVCVFLVFLAFEWLPISPVHVKPYHLNLNSNLIGPRRVWISLGSIWSLSFRLHTPEYTLCVCVLSLRGVRIAPPTSAGRRPGHGRAVNQWLPTWWVDHTMAILLCTMLWQYHGHITMARLLCTRLAWNGQEWIGMVFYYILIGFIMFYYVLFCFRMGYYVLYCVLCFRMFH